MFDCTMINDELDLLEIRLNILYPFIEKFVIVESDRTHSGKLKELSFIKNKLRFKHFSSKIIYLTYSGHEAPNGNMAWGNENSQRNMILEALKFSQPNDGLFFVSDVDEIPRPEKLFEAKCSICKSGMPVAFEMYNCMYFMNMMAEKPYRGPYLYNPHTAKEIHYNLFHALKYSPSDFRWHVCAPGYERDFNTIKEAGWHFSTMGGINAIRKKLESYAHLEYDKPEFKMEDHLLKCIQDGIPYFEKKDDNIKDKLRFKMMPLSFLPDYIAFNMKKYIQYIYFQEGITEWT